MKTVVMFAAILASTIVLSCSNPPARESGSTDGDCSLGGQPVSCEVFKEQILTETVDDLGGLDCDSMVNLAALRIDGWATAEVTGRATYDEARAAGRAVSTAINQLGCGNSQAWRSYLAGLQ